MKKLLAIFLAAMIGVMLPITAMGATLADFTDIPTGWSRDAVVSAVDNSLIVGSDNKVNPQAKATRAELVSILIRVFGDYSHSEDGADLSGYTDVDPNAWYYNELSVAVQRNLIYGYDDKTMRPNADVTREETAVIMTRMFILSGVDASLADFGDGVQVSSWANEGVAALVKAGYMNGYEDSTLKPKGLITREEIAQLLHNIVKMYVNEPGVYTVDVDGIVVVRAPGVTFVNSHITGDVLFSDEPVRVSTTFDSATTYNRVIVSETRTIEPHPSLPNPDTPPRGGSDTPTDGDTTTPPVTPEVTPPVTPEVTPPVTPPVIPPVGGGGGGGGGGSTTPIYYTVYSDASASIIETNIEDDDLIDQSFYVAIGTLMRDDQVTKNSPFKSLFTSFLSGGVWSSDEFRDNNLSSRVVPRTATLSEENGNPEVRLEYVDGPFTIYSYVTVTNGVLPGRYKVTVREYGASISVQSGSRSVTGTSSLYNTVFSILQTTIQQSSTRVSGKGLGVNKAEYVQVINDWFYNYIASPIPSANITGATGVLPSVLTNKSVTAAAVSGASWRIVGDGFDNVIRVVRA
jgi:hypothetical protein